MLCRQYAPTMSASCSISPAEGRAKLRAESSSGPTFK